MIWSHHLINTTLVCFDLVIFVIKVFLLIFYSNSQNMLAMFFMLLQKVVRKLIHSYHSCCLLNGLPGLPMLRSFQFLLYSWLVCFLAFSTFFNLYHLSKFFSFLLISYSLGPTFHHHCFICFQCIWLCSTIFKRWALQDQNLDSRDIINNLIIYLTTNSNDKQQFYPNTNSVWNEWW